MNPIQRGQLVAGLFRSQGIKGSGALELSDAVAPVVTAFDLANSPYGGMARKFGGQRSVAGVAATYTGVGLLPSPQLALLELQAFSILNSTGGALEYRVYVGTTAWTKGAAATLTDVSGASFADAAAAAGTHGVYTIAALAGRLLMQVSVAGGDSKLIQLGEPGFSLNGQDPAVQPIIIVPNAVNTLIEVSFYGRLWVI